MKVALYLLLFLATFGIAFYFLLLNSHQSVSLNLWGGITTPELPVGIVVLFSFFGGFLIGYAFLLLTYIIKRLYP